LDGEQMSDLTRLLIIVGGIGLAILLPWFIYAALKRERPHVGRDAVQGSVQAIQKTLRGQQDDIDELSRRVAALRNQEDKHDAG
jgi:sensor domain CHASE-containing protein